MKGAVFVAAGMHNPFTPRLPSPMIVAAMSPFAFGRKAFVTEMQS
jgi:hypothetical protein